MKEKIYTIPVTEAFNSDCECPFCTMYEQLEKNSIEFVLGPSYMEVDVRGETNEMGFCREHLNKLYMEKNRLGLALMLHTHMNKIQADLEKLINTNNKVVKKTTLFAKKNDIMDNKIFTYIKHKENSCYICNKINSTFERYIDTFFYLWKKDKDFRDTVKNSKGFCLNHFAIIYNNASKYLSGKSLDEFINIIVPIQLDNLKRVSDDLDWFIKKYDYRFANEPWKNSKDALPRTIKKINSLNI